MYQLPQSLKHWVFVLKSLILISFRFFADVFTKRELNGLCLHCTNQGCPCRRALMKHWRWVGVVRREGERRENPSRESCCMTLIHTTATNETKTVQLIMDNFLWHIGTFCCLWTCFNKLYPYAMQEEIPTLSPGRIFENRMWISECEVWFLWERCHRRLDEGK